jgi:hypothetical protein
MTRKTKADNREKEERLRDIRMIETPDHWPLWPTLPLKRYTPDERGVKRMQVGFMVAVEERRWHVYLSDLISASARAKKKAEGKIGTVKDLVEGIESLTYENAAAIVDDGWEVD